MDELDRFSPSVSFESSHVDGEGSRFAIVDRRSASLPLPPAPQVDVTGLGHRTYSSGQSFSRAMPLSVIENWSKFGASGLSPKMYQKIVRLAGRPDGWRGSGSKALSSLAVGGFLEFWSQVAKSSAQPELALTPSGGLHAQWYAGPGMQLGLTFESNGLIYFGLFNGQRIMEGVQPLDMVLSLLRGDPSRPLSWNR